MKPHRTRRGRAIVGAALAVLGWLAFLAPLTEASAQEQAPEPSIVPPSIAHPRPAPPGPSTATGSPVPKLKGALADAAWRVYRGRFVTEQGRVVDTANGAISHSEGQGYGMLLAVAADDRESFERIWGWTRGNLMVRGDELLAWRWSPDKRPAVADMNDATDGDLLVAWALTEAGESWGENSYRTAARRIAVEAGRKAMLFKHPGGPIILPAVSGFSAAERRDGPLVNLSYWIFPALQRLSIAAPEYDWAGLIRSGVALLREARFGPARLPTEWISVKEAPPRPADGFPALFSYNAIRVPLYLAWADLGRSEDYAPFLAIWDKSGPEGLPIVDTQNGQPVERLTEQGYAALPALLACATRGTLLPGSFETIKDDENYYPTTLQLLAMVAARMRYPSCFNR